MFLASDKGMFDGGPDYAFPFSLWSLHFGGRVKNERLLSDVRAQARHFREQLTPRVRMWFTVSRGIKAGCLLSSEMLPPSAT